MKEEASDLLEKIRLIYLALQLARRIADISELPSNLAGYLLEQEMLVVEKVEKEMGMDFLVESIRKYFPTDNPTKRVTINCYLYDEKEFDK